MVKPFLEPKTYKKVKFVYSDDNNTKKIMEDLFNMDQLESAFGGKDNSGFDINKYAERMREDDKKMPAFWARINPPCEVPQPALANAQCLNSINPESDSDASSSHGAESDNIRETRVSNGT